MTTASRPDQADLTLPLGAQSAPTGGCRRLLLALPMAGFVLALGDWLVTPRNPAWALFLLLCALAATAVAWLLANEGKFHLLEFLEHHASRIVLSLILLAAVGLIVLNTVQARRFALGAYPEDLAYYNQIFWNTLHGRFLSGNVQQERLYSPPVSSDFALHVSPVMLVALLPIYAIFPSFLMFQVLRDLVLAAAAWPLFYTVRDRLGGSVGVAAVVLYLANPAVLAQGFGSFTLLNLVPLPFFAALLAFTRRDFRMFACWTLVTVGIREDAFIAVAGFGLWAVVARYSFRWFVMGLVVPVAWWGFATLIVQPAFGRWGNSALDVALAGGSATPLATYQILFGDPSWVIDGLRQQGFSYLYQLIRWVGLLPMLGLEGVLAFPSLTASLFLGRVHFAGTDPLSRFAMLSACALIGASVIVVARLAGRLRLADARLFGVVALLLLPSASLIDGLKEAIRLRLLAYAEGHDAAVLNEAIRRVPDHASVAAPTYALPALSSRERLFTLQYLHMYPNRDVEYFLFDRKVNRVTTNPELRDRYIKLLEELSHPTEHETVWQHGEYFLVRRVGPKL